MAELPNMSWQRWRIAILPPDLPQPELGDPVILVEEVPESVEICRGRAFAYIKKGKRWVTLATYYK